MKIYFKKVILHHFLSFGDAEIDLDKRNYCLVKGINHNPKNGAVSNGSGKSTWLSAICWALTGETVQGETSNIPNIYFNDGCYVTLCFNVDKDEYEITRYKNYEKIGTNLKVIINGEDKSGKGIRESESILHEYLPDLTAQLLCSVVILGQGLPQKFSNNTPSGRKEVLEKLSKSDFMIEDIKERINSRITKLNEEIRKVENELLTNNNYLSMTESQCQQAKQTLANMQSDTELKSKLEEFEKTLQLLSSEKETLSKIITKLDNDKNVIQESINSTYSEQNKKIEADKIAHEQFQAEETKQETLHNSERISLEAEIKRLESITDICPTCHQKLPNVVKPDTTEQKKKLAELNKLLEDIKNIKNDDNSRYNAMLTEVQREYNTLRENYLRQQTEINTQYREIQQKLTKCVNDIVEVTNTVNKLKSEIEFRNKDKERLQVTIKDCESKILTYKDKILYNNKNKETLSQHLDIVNKINTLVKRDFRGYLLSNVIAYIDAKAKEYATEIFNTNELDFKLEGNNIDITYCGISYQALSGGEKQRVDLILQFALRDMLCKYFDFSSNILALDEITDALDNVACEKVLNFISKRLNDTESIFIISHRADELEIPCDDEIVIEKDSNNVSRVL